MNEITTFKPDEATATEASRADKALAFAKALAITDADSYTLGGKAISQCKIIHDAIDKLRKHFKEPHLEGSRRIDAFFKPRLEMLKKSEGIISDKRAEHRRKEETERLELERQRAIAQQKIEAKAAKAAAKAKSPEEAQAIKTKAVLETPAPIASTIPKDDGMVIATTWKGECLSITELAVSVAAVPSNASFLLINQTMLDSRAREQGEMFSLPGCKAVKVETEKRGRR